ncbi:hypothetical protein T439DRAFT_324850 [Meredithblackwellia eburnea MCA 4105]
MDERELAELVYSKRNKFSVPESALDFSIFNALKPFDIHNPNQATLAKAEHHLTHGSTAAYLDEALKGTSAEYDTTGYQRRSRSDSSAMQPVRRKLSEVQRGKQRAWDLRAEEEQQAESGYDSGERRTKSKHRMIFGGDVVVAVPDIEVPDDFPSSDLLAAIQSHAANRFASQGLLHPPLTRADPDQSLFMKTKVHLLKKELDDQDDSIANDKTWGHTAKYKRARRQWLKKSWQGVRKKAWKNMERQFEPSALVALGVLDSFHQRGGIISKSDRFHTGVFAELMAADALYDPMLNPNRNIEQLLALQNELAQVHGHPVQIASTSHAPPPWAFMHDFNSHNASRPLNGPDPFDTISLPGNVVSEISDHSQRRKMQPKRARTASVALSISTLEEEDSFDDVSSADGTPELEADAELPKPKPRSPRRTRQQSSREETMRREEEFYATRTGRSRTPAGATARGSTGAMRGRKRQRSELVPLSDDDEPKKNSADIARQWRLSRGQGRLGVGRPRKGTRPGEPGYEAAVQARQGKVSEDE